MTKEMSAAMHALNESRAWWNQVHPHSSSALVEAEVARASWGNHSFRMESSKSIWPAGRHVQAAGRSYSAQYPWIHESKIPLTHCAFPFDHFWAKATALADSESEKHAAALAASKAHSANRTKLTRVFDSSHPDETATYFMAHWGWKQPSLKNTWQIMRRSFRLLALLGSLSFCFQMARRVLHCVAWCLSPPHSGRMQSHACPSQKSVVVHLPIWREKNFLNPGSMSSRPK